MSRRESLRSNGRWARVVGIISCYSDVTGIYHKQLCSEWPRAVYMSVNGYQSLELVKPPERLAKCLQLSKCSPLDRFILAWCWMRLIYTDLWPADLKYFLVFLPWALSVKNEAQSFSFLFILNCVQQSSMCLYANILTNNFWTYSSKWYMNVCMLHACLHQCLTVFAPLECSPQHTTII